MHLLLAGGPQVEETRRRYALEVEGLKAELALLAKQRVKQRKETDIATVTANAAKAAAQEATDELEALNGQLRAARRELDVLHGWGGLGR
jgi:seryl-tRNA synthetase